MACRLVRLAAERHLRDLEEGPKRGLRWQPASAVYACEFFRYLRHSKGEFGGQSFELSPWQKFVIGSVWGWKRKDGTRRFRVVWQEVPRKNGKAVAVDTPVLTPTGWVRHGDLRPGDQVFAPDGQPRKVLASTPKYEGPCYRLRFSDGTSVVAHDRHEWVTQRSWYTGRHRGSRAPLPNVETAEIAATLRMTGRGDLVHGIPVAAPLDMPDAELPIPPYTFGAWLGDGNSGGGVLTCADAEIVHAIRAEGVSGRELSGRRGAAGRFSLSPGVKGSRRGFTTLLRNLGVLESKAIPRLYRQASIEQRRQVLAGLIDTDGHVTVRGQCELVLTNPALFRTAVELIRSLGFKPTVTEDRATLNGRDIGPRYRLQFWPDAASLPLRVPRKRDRLREHAGGRCRTRMIVDAERVAACMVNCIQVEGGLYLVGEGLVTTHNSTLLAGVGLLALIADDEPGAEVYTAATKKDQAKIIFDEAKRMIAASPELNEEVRRFKSNLSVDRTGSKFEPLSADEKTLDGLNPHCALIDEVHKHKSRAVLDVLDTAMGSRRQPLLWQITTAGDDSPESVYAQENDYAIKVLEGVVQDDNLFAFIATIDEMPHDEILSGIAALQHLDKTCNCGRVPAIRIEGFIAEACASHATGSGETEIRKASAQTIQNAPSMRRGSARPATISNPSQHARIVKPGQPQQASSGEGGTPSEREQSKPVTEQSRSPSGESGKRESLATASLPQSIPSGPSSNANDADSVERKQNLYAWITRMIREKFGVSSAGNAIPASVFSEILKKTYFAHSPTCDARQGRLDGESVTITVPGDQWDDPAAWRKANPNFGISVKLDDLKRQAAKAKNSPSALVAFKRLRLNVRTADATKFIEMPTWRKNSLGQFDPDDMRGRGFYGAFDLSSKIDLSCWLKLFPPREAGERWRVVPRFWMPADTVDAKSDRDQVQYRRWIHDGLIEVTAGNVIDHQEIEDAILEDCRHFRPIAIAYDSWNATQMATSLHGKGKPVYEFIQGVKSYTAPTKELEAWLLAEKLDHGGNPVLAWMASNLKVQKDKNENLMPTKAKSIGRIDGITSLIMSIGMYLTKTAANPYEERGPRVA